MPLKPCIEPHGALHRGLGPRCPTCTADRERTRDQARGTTTERGYGWTHQQARADLLADAPLCAHCGVRPATQADHDTPLARGGRSESAEDYVASCDHCNLSKGDRDRPVTFPQVRGGRHVSAGQGPKP